VESQRVSELIDDILNKMQEYPESPIVLHLSSPGGDPDVGIFFYKTAKMLRFPLVTIAVHEVASATLFMYLAGQQRDSLPDASFLFHNLKNGLEGFFERDELRHRLDYMTEDENKIVRILAEATGNTEDAVRKICNKADRMSAEEAQKFGVVHNIIEDKTGVAKRRKK